MIQVSNVGLQIRYIPVYRNANIYSDYWFEYGCWTEEATVCVFNQSAKVPEPSESTSPLYPYSWFLQPKHRFSCFLFGPLSATLITSYFIICR